MICSAAREAEEQRRGGARGKWRRISRRVQQRRNRQTLRMGMGNSGHQRDDRNHKVRASKHGPLPGAKQTNNREELWAFINCLESTAEKLIYWTDSEVTAIDWYATRKQNQGRTGATGDLAQSQERAGRERRQRAR